VAALAGRASKTARPAVVCRSSQGLEPFPGLYSVRLLTPLAGYLKTERHLIRFVERSAPEVLPEDEVRRWDPGERSFFNLNTMADWREAERWLAAAAD
jgi:molybdopterin-guanine dinucleotide biosynthesis protein A